MTDVIEIIARYLKYLVVTIILLAILSFPTTWLYNATIPTMFSGASEISYMTCFWFLALIHFVKSNVVDLSKSLSDSELFD